ncbi:hypothetical protein F5Y15DRAFT_403972 [Xylariaceae sp. FL0016]|nr:hypothetical protein F5Y15DRAFT_403972 [Xylariaceae sp. FL0016]
MRTNPSLHEVNEFVNKPTARLPMVRHRSPGSTPSSSGLLASRRSHPKSRSGCKTCKSRKIKCDEQKPQCGNCTKHNVDCDFLTLEAASSPGPKLSLTPSGLSMADLELMHNYTTSTFTTLSENSVLRDFYRVTAVQLGLNCDYIMRTILAVSALHLAHYRPQMRDYYQSIAMNHHQIASRAVMDLMSDINPDTAQSLFLFSVMTIFFALACPRKEDGFLLIGESGFPDWLFLLQGTRTFIGVMGVQSFGPLAPLFKHGIDRWTVREDNMDQTSPATVHLDNIRMQISQSVTDGGLLETYQRALEELQKSFSIFDSGRNVPRDLTDAFVWIFMVADDFLPLLRAPTQEALTIFAYFCILLKRLERQWWMHGWADHLIAKTHSLLDDEHKLWIRWPIEEMGWVS